MNKFKNSPQRKTTLKWLPTGELSSIDMARVIDKLSAYDLKVCSLTCDVSKIIKESN